MTVPLRSGHNHGVWHLIDQISQSISQVRTRQYLGQWECIRTKWSFLIQGQKWKFMAELWMKKQSNGSLVQRSKLVIFDKRKSFFLIIYNLWHTLWINFTISIGATKLLASDWTTHLSRLLQLLSNSRFSGPALSSCSLQLVWPLPYSLGHP